MKKVLSRTSSDCRFFLEKAVWSGAINGGLSLSRGRVYITLYNLVEYVERIETA